MPEAHNYNLGRLAVYLLDAGVKYDTAVNLFRRQYVTATLMAARGNQCRAASELGIHRNTIRRLCDELEIDPAAIGRAVRRKRRAERASA